MSNYRPISLLSTVRKAIKKIVHKHIVNFFQENHVITTLKSGFVPGDSTVNQLTDLYNTFCQALDEGKEIRAVFCDIRGERGGSVVECRTPEREVRGSRPTAAVLCP